MQSNDASGVSGLLASLGVMGVSFLLLFGLSYQRW